MINSSIKVGILTLASLYYLLSAIFHWAYTAQIIGSLVVLSTVFAYIDYATTYEDAGVLIISKNDNGGKLFSLELEIDPEEIESRPSVSFKVINQET